MFSKVAMATIIASASGSKRSYFIWRLVTSSYKVLVPSSSLSDIGKMEAVL